MTEEDDQLIVELDGEVFKLDTFKLTFGDVMAAQQKARISNSKGSKYHKQHEVFWLVNRLFKKNGFDLDISWLSDVPIHEMKHVLEKIDEHNPGFNKKD